MSLLKIEWVGAEPNEWGEGVNKTYYYNVKGTFEGEKKSTSIGVKNTSNAPKVGDEIEGYFYTDAKGKERFKKEIQTKTFSGGGRGTYVPSPATEIPYLSLKAAVELAGYNIQSGKEIKGSDVVKLAQVFQKYLEGEKIKETPATKTTAPEEEFGDLSEYASEEE